MNYCSKNSPLRMGLRIPRHGSRCATTIRKSAFLKGVSPDQPFVQILDPATGTATFLVEVIDVIHETLTTKWKKQSLTGAQQRDAWNAYVPEHLLPRLHAFELMMAPYAIAHMKIGLKLAETGYRFGTEERARIYLTNALEPPQDFSTANRLRRPRPRPRSPRRERNQIVSTFHRRHRQSAVFARLRNMSLAIDCW